MQRWVELLGREPEPGELGPLAQRGYDGGRRVSGQQALWGWQTLRLINIQILERFQAFDVFLTPTMSHPSPRIDWLDPLTVDVKEFDKRQAATYGTTPPFNFTGQPSLSLPLWQSADNLPLGMMFTGQFGDEATLYRLAGQLEKELPWAGRKPPIWG
jgi:amidase